ncbi:hypothetical protein K450DRAFT_247054 [Umbelopsis ramanniana AG]|uniref:Methyltransferase domain-containing protein n=1 Tax=Umbelopsis ramanniana AG TaxID=1314678 RepID=A0AAD5E7T1_UMBRA|nr:uncharacterized protein K450DRAFT_247054 [Umbelopsis ramanniana AG]KAI8578482.1 hypothetical protein K450DRAFT_247054 [Umbelopsis ramanniana AG]
MPGFFSRLKWTLSSKKPQNKEIKEEKPKLVSETSDSAKSLPQIHTASVYTYGRRFQAYKDCAYVLPNDDTEIDRLHLQHWIVKNAVGRNYSSPIEAELEKGIKVLDAGCGGGTWTLEMASAYPNSIFTGLDVSSTWPTEIRPHNCNFVVGNLVHELPFDENSFDFVYMRIVGMGIPNEQYATVLSHLYKVLKPGGWIELVEMDGEQVYRGQKTTLYWNAVQQYLKTRGFKDGIVRDIDLKLGDTGYVNIDGLRIRIPVGGWGGKLGEVFLEDIVSAYKSLRPVVQPILKFSDEEFQELLDNVPKENNEVKQEVNLFMNWAQKPAN